MSARRFSTLQDLAEFFGKRCLTWDQAMLTIDDFPALRNAVDGIAKRMPGIGFFSPKRRIRCFNAVCAQLDALIERGMLTLDDALIAIDVLRFESRKFRKACRVFRRRVPAGRLLGAQEGSLVGRCYADTLGSM